MKTHWTKSTLRIVSLMALSLILSVTLSACVVAPTQPIGYRMTSEVLPTYVDGQYVGMQSSDYVTSEQVSTYVQPSVPSQVYTQTTTPIYPYSPPVYVNPWYGIGTGVGIGIGVNYSRGCCWRSGWRHHGWHHRGWHGGRHYHGGHRAWHR